VLSETIQVASVYWLATAEAPASQVASASSYRCPENIFGLSIVETERKLIQVQRQVFLADVVIGADDSPLQERPERFDILSVHVAAYVFASAVANGFMGHNPSEIAIAGVLIGRDQINLVADSLANESSQGGRIRVLDHLADDVALARDRANDGRLTRRSGAALPFVPMAVAVLSTDIGFVDFDYAHKLAELGIGKSGSEPMADEPRGAVRTGTDHPVDLQSADSLLAGQHQVENLEPDQQPIVRVLENRVDGDGEPIRRTVGLPAVGALPMEGPRLAGVHFFVPASRATDALGPTLVAEIRLAGILIGKHPVESRKGQLTGELRFVFVAVLVHETNIAIPC
jgi:hypothetical protein